VRSLEFWLLELRLLFSELGKCFYNHSTFSEIMVVKAILSYCLFICCCCCCLQELELLLEVNRLAHRLMSEYIKLDPWDAMFKEVNQAVNTDHGRISLHIFWELHYDFLPNFCYNSTTDRQVCFLSMSLLVTPVRIRGLMFLCTRPKACISII